MFTYWGTMLLAPWMMMEPEFPELQKSFLRFCVAFTLLYWLVALVVPSGKGGFFFGFVLSAAGYTTLNGF